MRSAGGFLGPDPTLCVFPLLQPFAGLCLLEPLSPLFVLLLLLLAQLFSLVRLPLCPQKLRLVVDALLLLALQFCLPSLLGLDPLALLRLELLSQAALSIVLVLQQLLGFVARVPGTWPASRRSCGRCVPGTRRTWYSRLDIACEACLWRALGAVAHGSGRLRACQRRDIDSG